MRTDFYFNSNGVGQIHCCKWSPVGEVKAIVQIVHGIAEFVERYDEFARYLNDLGFLVVAEDHMGHGKSINATGTQGYFNGGWFTAVSDSVELMKRTMAEYPEVPYILFGHSMGSFMARTILCENPKSGISAAVICGTGWQSRMILPAGIGISELVCKSVGEKNPSEKLNNFVFGSYNAHIKEPRTAYDWLSRNEKSVDDYVAHPLCGFTPSAGLLRDMMMGIQYIEKPRSLARMKKDLPVLFIAGGEDPVGSYGKGVHQAAAAFRKAGMRNVTERIFPGARHEILNETNREEVYKFTAEWIGKFI